MIRTPFTQSFDLQHAVVLGPMGGVAGGRLAAAVSNAGGLGLVGGGYGDPAWLEKDVSPDAYPRSPITVVTENCVQFLPRGSISCMRDSHGLLHGYLPE